MAQKTRTGPSATPRKLYGSFSGKTEEGAPTGRTMGGLARYGGLVGKGGLAGEGGGLAG